MEARIQKSVEWFKKTLQKRKRPFSLDELQGSLLVLSYDPKTKTEMPYYDRYPCIFVLSVKSDSLLGLNLHYLDYREREKLILHLYLMGRNKNSKTEETKLNATYPQVKEMGISFNKRYANVVMKRYLFSHLKNLIIIPASEWNYVSFLPIQKFEKKNATFVWKESRENLNGG